MMGGTVIHVYPKRALQATKYKPTMDICDAKCL